MLKVKSIEASMKFSVENVIRYGDTDIFPYPIERQIFRDKKEETIELLNKIYHNFEQFITQMPIEHEKLLNAVGYTGFRQGTQIDPIWNVYLLGIVCFIGEDIEKIRINKEKDIVFSYRFNPDETEYTIFDRDYAWITFQKKSLELAKDEKNKFVLTCDISDFYPRIYHHRLENALKKATKKSDVIRQIKFILNGLSKGASYGLPVGGPAARLLSELLLNRVDRLLLSQNIKFCRFVDDYNIFAETKEQIYGNLVYFSEALLNNEGLSLQKNKTRILSSSEFLETSVFSDVNEPEDQEEKNKRNFIKIHLHYDPYSDTADEDYEALCEEINKFDIIGMLTSEMQKTRVAEGLTKKLIKAIAHLEGSVKDQAVLSLLDNFHVLYPILSSVMILLISVINEISFETREKVFSTIRFLLDTKSYLFKVPVNLSFAIRILSYNNSEETDNLLIKLFSETSIMMVKRDIILILAQHNADYWISDHLKRFNAATAWEKRSLLIASYILEDEGSEWRKRIKTGLTSFDELVLIWASNQKACHKVISL
jgi:hypothetical protein